MFDYALRCIESDYDELINNATLLGVIDMIDGKPFEKNGGIWDEIGYKFDANGVAFTDANGNKYVHINVRSPLDVDAIARELAGTYPEIAQGLVEFNRFFITDPDTGKWTWPKEPMRVFL
jgi:hypothetical protein